MADGVGEHNGISAGHRRSTHHFFDCIISVAPIDHAITTS
jgi:hypothetical protein